MTRTPAAKSRTGKTIVWDPAERAARQSRQLILPDVGPEGQARLEAARVVVVGCGGLGAPVIQYLAAAGVGHMTLYDDDRVEASNLNRQVLHRSSDVGRPKAERAAEWVAELDPALSVEPRVQRLGVRDAREAARAHDLMVDCSDGLPVKYLLNDACVLEDRALVHGAATGLEGQVLFVPGAGGPCLRCLFEDIPPPGTVPSCQEAGVLGATTALVGSLMAMAALKHIVGFGEAGAGRFLSVDAGGLAVRPMRFGRREDCAACGGEPEVDARTPDDYEPRSCER
jgi:adenylyltransferase/sulfurtransferase